MTSLDRAHWPAVEQRPAGILIWPIGSTEQHGPHLPLGTDTFLAERVAEAIHRQRPDSDLAPALPLGASGEHSGFPGTLSIGTPALTTLLIEAARDASRWWPGLLIVNGHGGNLDALTAATRVCEAEGRHVAVVHLAVPGMDAHAGASETSLMLHLAPDRVRRDQIVKGRTERIGEIHGVLRESGVRALSPTGVLGDPTTATADQGVELFDQLVARALARHDELARRVGATS